MFVAIFPNENAIARLGRRAALGAKRRVGRPAPLHDAGKPSMPFAMMRLASRAKLLPLDDGPDNPSPGHEPRFLHHPPGHDRAPCQECSGNEKHRPARPRNPGASARAQRHHVGTSERPVPHRWSRRDPPTPGRLRAPAPPRWPSHTSCRSHRLASGAGSSHTHPAASDGARAARS
jgi:hypothetical protein